METWETVGRPESSLSVVSESKFLLYKLYVLKELNFSMLRFSYLQNMYVDDNNHLIDCNEN